jgi:hypothetical protein
MFNDCTATDCSRNTRIMYYSYRHLSTYIPTDRQTDARTLLPTYLLTYLSMAVQSFVRPWPLFQFLNLIHSRQNSLDKGLARREAATCTQDSQTQNKSIQTSMPQVGFEPTIQVFERAKTVHALHCAATVIGYS